MTSRTKPLCTCTSDPRWGINFTCSLVGRPSTRGRIYVACGEHPAAGGLYVFFCTLGLYPMRSCLVVLVGTYGCLCASLRGLVVSLSQFGWPWGSIVAPWVSILTHMGCSWESFRHFGGPWGFMSAPLGSIWVPLGSMLVSCGHFWVWPWTHQPTFVENAKNRRQN